MKEAVPIEFANRQMKNLRCVNCHKIDDQESIYAYAFEDEGSRGLQAVEVPMLTFAGEKLLGDWMDQQISGRLDYRTREHFTIQMPAFPARGSVIASGLCGQHGFEKNEDKRPWPIPTSSQTDSDNAAQILKSRKRLAQIGSEIAAMEKGLACMRCHPIGDKKPVAAFDALSTNFAYASDRLRYEYFTRWMFDPQRVDSTTKMLKFSPDRKTTTFKPAFDGDARKQFEALWLYLESLDRAKE